MHLCENGDQCRGPGLARFAVKEGLWCTYALLWLLSLVALWLGDPIKNDMRALCTALRSSWQRLPKELLVKRGSGAARELGCAQHCS